MVKLDLFVFVFLSIIFYKKRTRKLCNGASFDSKKLFSQFIFRFIRSGRTNLNKKKFDSLLLVNYKDLGVPGAN